MERIDPHSFRGPRAYFTAFDYRIVERTRNRDKLHREVERKLKALLLLKSHIVCAASHLTSRFAYEIFAICPELLSESHIIPAFRVDKQTIDELFERKRFPGKEEALHFFKEHVATTVNWELRENSNWFRERFISELRDNRSVIRRNLTDVPVGTIESMVDEIASSEVLSRALIESYAADLPRKARQVLLNYRELVYHMSGARVVNCESSLPQENYIDYDLADISQRRTKLSEEQILWKLLIESVLESFQRAMIPVELLDTLSFQDILAIRKPLLESPFQDEYDRLINTAIHGIGTSPGRLFDIYELERIRETISNTFHAVIEEEIPSYIRRRAKEERKEMWSTSASVALGLLGFVPVPGIGVIAGAAGLLKDTPALIFNVGQAYRSARSVSCAKDYIDFREQLLVKSIEHTQITEKTALIDMVHMLLMLIRSRMEV